MRKDGSDHKHTWVETKAPVNIKKCSACGAKSKRETQHPIHNRS